MRDYPWINAVKCFCHLIHLCSSHASKKLPKFVEELCRNMFSHFNLSSKRCESFKEFQQFVELKELKILHPGKYVRSDFTTSLLAAGLLDFHYRCTISHAQLFL